MNPNQLMSAVESRDDIFQQAIDDANCAIDDADTAARYGTTRAEVLERLTETISERGDKIFMRALRNADKQSISQMITLIQDAFESVVREKRNTILTGGDRH